MRRKKKNSGTVKQVKRERNFIPAREKTSFFTYLVSLEGKGRKVFGIFLSALFFPRERGRRREQRNRNAFVIGRYMLLLLWLLFVAEGDLRKTSRGLISPGRAQKSLFPQERWALSRPFLPSLALWGLLCKFECAYSTTNSIRRESFTYTVCCSLHFQSKQ